GYSNAVFLIFFFSSRRRHTRFSRDWSSDVCSSDLEQEQAAGEEVDDGGDPLAHVQAVGAEHAEEGQQYPGQVEVDPPGAEARIRLPVYGRDQKQVNDPANEEQAQGEEVQGPRPGFAVIETVGPHEAENP